VLDVRVATEDEIRDFQSRHRRAAQFDDQIALDLNDMRKEAAARRSKKEPS
jgi:hypothetical protein